MCVYKWLETMPFPPSGKHKKCLAYGEKYFWSVCRRNVGNGKQMAIFNKYKTLKFEKKAFFFFCIAGLL